MPTRRLPLVSDPARVLEPHTILDLAEHHNNIHMWPRNSTPDSRKTWLTSPDAVAAPKPSTIITGHKDPDAPDDDATRVLDQSRRIEHFEHTVAKSSTPLEVIQAMLAKYPAYGNRYTLFAAAFTQFPA